MTTALVTGGNRGIGLEICRQLGALGMKVLLASRDMAACETAAAQLKAQGLDVTALTLDVGKAASINACARKLGKDGIAVDVLVNNAGFLAEGDLLTGPTRPMDEAVGVNLMAPYRMARAFVPAMIARGHGRVVNLSSSWGAFSRDLEGPAAYAVTKTALNALTVRLAREAGPAVKVNCMCPGWVQTRMGGDGANRPVAEGADTAVYLATLPDDGPTGGFFRDRQPIAW